MKKALSYLIAICLFVNVFMININVFSYEFQNPDNEYNINLLKDKIYEITEEYYTLYKMDDNTSYSNVNNNKFWWPIGSAEVSEENGKKYAKGNPETTVISSYFGEREDPYSGEKTHHNGLDITGGSGYNVNIIAAKSGTVVYPTEGANLACHSDSSLSSCGGGYGNYVIIEHSDGTYTLYGHMYENSITVHAGDTVEQGQVIGKMGSSGKSTGPHLHFEIRVGQNAYSAAVDPLNYISADDPRPNPSFSGSFSITTTSLSKTEFETCMRDYAARANVNSNFSDTFVANAGMIYDTAVGAGINPELVVVTAMAESGASYHSSNNYWGIGVPNGAASGAVFSSFEEGIKGYAQVLNSYMTGSNAQMINSRAAERQAAGCDPAGYGTPDTLAGQQSIYSWIGTYRLNPGGSGAGGCYYLNIIYGANYCSTVATCPNDKSCNDAAKTTVCEQNDYTAWQVSQKAKIRFDIFGI